jgi:ribosomal protein S3
MTREHSREHDSVHVRVVRLRGGLAVSSAEQRVQLLERTLRPDDEAAHVATRRQLQQVQAVHIRELDARQVAECLVKTIRSRVHHERAAAGNITPVPHLALASTHFL